jgi:hypothetical protein
MNFSNLIKWAGSEPVFETGLLLAGDVRPAEVRKQLSRWVSARKVYQIRRGLYALGSPYQKVKPHPFHVANRIRPASYVGLQSALAYYGLIPEHVPVTTSVTTGRPGSFNTPIGAFEFRHVQVVWFYAYSRVDLGNDQSAFVARPEKALLDLIYLEPGSDAPAYLQELRLQNLERLDLELLHQLVQKVNKPKLWRAFEIIQQLCAEEKSGYGAL